MKMAEKTSTRKEGRRSGDDGWHRLDEAHLALQRGALRALHLPQRAELHGVERFVT